MTPKNSSPLSYNAPILDIDAGRAKLSRLLDENTDTTPNGIRLKELMKELEGSRERFSEVYRGAGLLNTYTEGVHTSLLAKDGELALAEVRGPYNFANGALARAYCGRTVRGRFYHANEDIFMDLPFDETYWYYLPILSTSKFSPHTEKDLDVPDRNILLKGVHPQEVFEGSAWCIVERLSQSFGSGTIRFAGEYETGMKLKPEAPISVLNFNLNIHS